MKNLSFYQGSKLSVTGTVSQMGIIFQSSYAPHAEFRVGANKSSMLLSTNATNSIVHSMCTTAYAPYGHADLSQHGTVLAFNGQVRDPITGLDPLGNGKRLYSPTQMRFLSPDSYSPFGLGGINTYAYCGGDPINYTDPTGNIKFFVLTGRHYNDPILRVAPSTTMRNRNKPVGVVRPMRNGEPVNLRAQSGTDRPPAPQEGASARPASPTVLNGPFTNEEKQMVAHVIGFAQANNLPNTPQTHGARKIFSIVTARHLRLQRGGVSPIDRPALLNAFSYGAPEWREQMLSNIENWAATAISAYRARAS